MGKNSLRMGVIVSTSSVTKAGYSGREGVLLEDFGNRWMPTDWLIDWLIGLVGGQIDWLPSFERIEHYQKIPGVNLGILSGFYLTWAVSDPRSGPSARLPNSLCMYMHCETCLLPQQGTMIRIWHGWCRFKHLQLVDKGFLLGLL